MCKWVGIFQKLRDFIVMTLLAPREKCHLDFSPKSCTYPTAVTIDPAEVMIISILLHENNYFPMLFCTFTIDNRSFITTANKKKCSVYHYFQYKSSWFVNSNCFPSWKDWTVCLAQLTFMILYLSHYDVTAWHRPDLLNPCNI